MQLLNKIKFRVELGLELESYESASLSTTASFKTDFFYVEISSYVM